MLKLYYMPGACSMVPHIALEETGAQYETALVDFARGDQLKREFLQINPKARVPALETDRGVLTEIPAILGYIAAKFPAARLANIEDRYAFADMQAFHMFIATTIHVTFRQISRPDFYADGDAVAQALRAKVPEKSN
jgi:glutathione S-transferase